METSHESQVSTQANQVAPMATDYQLRHRHHHSLQEHSRHSHDSPFQDSTIHLPLAFRPQRNFHSPDPYRREEEETMRIRAEREARRSASVSDRGKESSRKAFGRAFTPMGHGHGRSEGSHGTETSHSDSDKPTFEAGQGHGTWATMLLVVWRLLNWMVLTVIMFVILNNVESGRYSACPLEARRNGSCPPPSPPQRSLTPFSAICHFRPFSSSTFLCSDSQRYHRPYTNIPPQELKSLADLSSKIDWIQTTLLNLDNQEELPAKLDDLSSCLTRLESQLTQVAKEISAINKLLAGGGDFSDQEKTLKALLGEIRKAMSTPGKERLTEMDIALITQLIEESLDDDTLKPDYALYSAGARIIHGLTTPTYRRGHSNTVWGRLNIFGRKTATTGRPPEMVLTPDVHAGECWAMSGNQGLIAIRLARPIVVKAVTIEHADSRVVFDIGSAPREIEVWSFDEQHADDNGLGHLEGVVSSPRWAPSNKDERALDNLDDDQADEEFSGTKIEGRWWREEAPYPGARLLTMAEYRTKDASDASAQRWTRRQTFSVPAFKQRLSSSVLLRINSNWGHPEFTCLYRVQVHGHPSE